MIAVAITSKKRNILMPDSCKMFLFPGIANCSDPSVCITVSSISQVEWMMILEALTLHSLAVT